jgi:hypothetical protein
MSKDCDGKNECNFKLKDLVTPSGDITSKDGVCGADAYLFIQVPCKVPHKYLGSRAMCGLVVGCIGVFIYLFVLVYIDYIKSIQ